MYFHRFTILLYLFCSLLAGRATDHTGWQVYLTCSNYKQMVHHQGLIYLLVDDNLFSANPDSITEPASYSRLSGLSGTYIHSISHTDVSNQMIIVYNDGNIDIIDSTLHVTNVPDFAYKVITGSRQINDVREQEGLFYISGDFGFFVLDPQRAIISRSSLTQESVYCTYTFDGRIFYSTPSGLYSSVIGASSNPDWQHVEGSCIPRQAVITTEGEPRCWVLTDDHRLLYQTSSTATFQTFWGSAYSFLRTDGAYLYTLFGNGPAFISLQDNSYCYVQGSSYARSAVGFLPLSDTECMFLDPTRGVIRSEIQLEPELHRLTLTTRYEQTLPEQMATTIPGQMIFSDGCLHCADVGNIQLIGSNGMSALHPYASTLDEDQIWNNVDLYAIHPQTKGITSFCQDHTRSNRFYYSTLGKGLFVIEGDSLVAHYTPDNSPLRDFAGITGYYRVGASYMDADGYLWMTNAGTDTVLCCLTPQARWIKYPIQSFSGETVSMPRKILDSQHDPYHFKWIYDTGFKGCVTAMYYDCGTPEDLSDDESVVFFSLTDQDGNVINPSHMNDIVEDRNGAIWLMTSSGPFVIEHPIDCYNTPGLVRRIKIPRNDGTNLADYLLPDVDCICCVVDAANRKWIGTNGNGLYCISADGLQQICNFTTANSPLLTNDILALAYDEESGTLYISCEGGIISYQTNAIRGAESFNNVYCYPNPVRPDYTGDLVITGLMDDSQVAITDVSGHVVYRSQSAGGSLTWDLTTTAGRRVAAGVYLVVATDSEGKKGIVTRFLVI